MSTLNILIGLPGSGKSTYAKKKLKDENVIYLSSDNIRVEMFGFEDQTHNSEVFNRMKTKTLEALENGFDVIYDATNISRKRRKDIIQLAKNNTNVKVVAYLFCCSIENILERNITRIERKIPRDKLENMISMIDVPFYYEGFDNIYLINTENNYYNDPYEYEEILNRCMKYDQNNPYHNQTLGEHILSVVEYVSSQKRYKFGKDRVTTITAARYHDFGKLYTRSTDSKGISHYYNHEKVSAYMYLCHKAHDTFEDNQGRIRLIDSLYQTALLIAHHMDYYKSDIKKTEQLLACHKGVEDNNLFNLLEILHEGDKDRSLMIGEF